MPALVSPSAFIKFMRGEVMIYNSISCDCKKHPESSQQVWECRKLQSTFPSMIFLCELLRTYSNNVPLKSLCQSFKENIDRNHQENEKRICLSLLSLSKILKLCPKLTSAGKLKFWTSQQTVYLRSSIRHFSSLSTRMESLRGPGCYGTKLNKVYGNSIFLF